MALTPFSIFAIGGFCGQKLDLARFNLFENAFFRVTQLLNVLWARFIPPSYHCKQATDA